MSEPKYAKLVAEQLKGHETRDVHNIAKRAMEIYGGGNAFVPVLPRRAGDWRKWDENETVVADEPAGYVYPAEMLYRLTKLWLEDLKWTIGPADALDAQAERIKALEGALRGIVKALADSDEEGLIEHAEQMIQARALLGEK